MQLKTIAADYSRSAVRSLPESRVCQSPESESAALDLGPRAAAGPGRPPGPGGALRRLRIRTRAAYRKFRKPLIIKV